MTQLASVVLALYRVLEEPSTDRGVQAWFRRELAARGLQAGTATVHRWLLGTQTPAPDVMARVWEIVAELHARAHAAAAADLRAIEALEVKRP